MEDDVLTVVDLLNAIISLPKPVRFVEVNEYGAHFEYASHEYVVSWLGASTITVEEVLGDVVKDTAHSRWIAGVLSGKKRNDAGELV